MIFGQMISKTFFAQFRFEKVENEMNVECVYLEMSQSPLEEIVLNFVPNRAEG